MADPPFTRPVTTKSSAKALRRARNQINFRWKTDPDGATSVIRGLKLTMSDDELVRWLTDNTEMPDELARDCVKRAQPSPVRVPERRPAPPAPRCSEGNDEEALRAAWRRGDLAETRRLLWLAWINSAPPEGGHRGPVLEWMFWDWVTTVTGATKKRAVALLRGGR